MLFFVIVEVFLKFLYHSIANILNSCAFLKFKNKFSNNVRLSQFTITEKSNDQGN